MSRHELTDDMAFTAGPATLPYAIETVMAMDLRGFQATINLTAGYYPGIELGPVVGYYPGKQPRIKGVPGTIIRGVNQDAVLVMDCPTPWRLENLHIETQGSGNGVHAHRWALLDLYGVTFGPCGGTQLVSTFGSFVDCHTSARFVGQAKGGIYCGRDARVAFQPSMSVSFEGPVYSSAFVACQHGGVALLEGIGPISPEYLHGLGLQGSFVGRKWIMDGHSRIEVLGADGSNGPVSRQRLNDYFPGTVDGLYLPALME